MAGSVHDQLHWKITVWEINVDITLPNCLEQEVPGQWTLDWWRDNSGFWQAAALWVIQAPLFIWLRVIRQPSDCPPASSHNWTIDVHNLTREMCRKIKQQRNRSSCVCKESGWIRLDEAVNNCYFTRWDQKDFRLTHFHIWLGPLKKKKKRTTLH